MNDSVVICFPGNCNCISYSLSSNMFLILVQKGSFDCSLKYFIKNFVYQEKGQESYNLNRIMFEISTFFNISI